MSTWTLPVAASNPSAWFLAHREEALDDLRAYVELETSSDDKGALQRGPVFGEA